VTEITPFKNFYVAEDYHKDYYENHQDAPYCSFVINPKVHKLIQKYGNDVKHNTGTSSSRELHYMHCLLGLEIRGQCLNARAAFVRSYGFREFFILLCMFTM
jgi:Peptide methionine sulfoxide reductase